MTKLNGPIEVSTSSHTKCMSNSSSLNSSSLRKHNCKNYDICLNLAASLDWEGFDCTQCTGHINEQLIWRAQSAQKKDSTVRNICPLPKIKCITAKTSNKIEKAS